MIFDQLEFDIRCEWGERGVATLAPTSDIVIIVDVLSFSTSVDIAVQQGAVVFPYRWQDDTAVEFALSVNAELADPKRIRGRYSLSPESLLHIRPGTRIVLPSPNGATLTLAAKPTPVLAGCLRNAQAVALAAKKYGSKIAVIPAGERWRDDHSLRPSFEDLIGAGAIISYLSGKPSPEAVSAVAAYRATQSRLIEYLFQCSSGKELIERGFGEDVSLASQQDVSECAPILIDAGFVRAEAKAQPEQTKRAAQQLDGADPAS
jgi:2-phosphosulfolactate phosphatase